MDSIHSPGGNLSTIREITVTDEPQLVDLLAAAFRDNPLNVAVIQRGPRWRLRSNRHGLRVLLKSVRGRASVLAALEDCGRPQAALIGLPPCSHPLPTPPLIDQLRWVLGQGLHVSERWGAVHDALLAMRPREAHWYLGILGVAGPCQGRGIGGRLLAHWLQRVDADRQPAWLETDREENLRFYARAGFEPACDLSLMGARVWCLRRGAAESGHSRHPGKPLSAPGEAVKI